MSLKAICAACGFIFDLSYGVSCPACRLAARIENVKQTFSPIDSLRTALGVSGIRPRDSEEYYRRLNPQQEEPEEFDVCIIPKYEEEQIWQLKRLFRK